MSKLLAAAIFAILSIVLAPPYDATAARTINLNQAGALEALHHFNPAHYEKVRKILEGVLQQPDRDVPRWIQTSFEARNVSYAPILLTSDPPKRRLSFALDDTRYEAIVTLTNMRGEIVPLK